MSQPDHHDEPPGRGSRLLLGIGVVALLLLFVNPFVPFSSSLGAWALGYVVGVPVTVELPDTCTLHYSGGNPDGTDKVTCPSATWSIGDEMITGTLVGRKKDLHHNGQLDSAVTARVFAGTAYLRPPVGVYAVVSVAIGLAVSGLVVSARGWIAVARRRKITSK